MSNNPRRQLTFEILISALVLLIVAFYIYSFFYQTPFIGFHVVIPTGEIDRLYSDPTSGITLQVGDVIQQVNGINWMGNPQQRLELESSFYHHAPGAVVLLRIQRAGQELEIPWSFPSYNREELYRRLFIFPWPLIALEFWLAGLVVFLIVRPREERRSLLAMTFYLVAIWLITGAIRDVNYSAVVFTLSSWMFVPVIWHLHWVFPHPLKPTRNLIWIIIYILGLLCAAIYLIFDPAFIFNILPLVLAVIGSVGLLCLHIFMQPKHRRQLLILLTCLSVSVLPAMLMIAGASQKIIVNSLMYPAALFLSTLPFGYIYALLYRQWGDLELRASSAISLILFGLTVFLGSYLAIYILATRLAGQGDPYIGIMLASVLTGLLTAVTYPHFRRWVERRLLGMLLPPAGILASFTNQIITAQDIDRLASLLENQIFPSLLIRQAVLLRIYTAEVNDAPLGAAQLIFRLNLNDDQLPQQADFRELLTRSGRVVGQPDSRMPSRLAWNRLPLANVTERGMIILCVLGQRDPDDYYSATELPTLQALVDSITLAIINIDQTRLLHALFQDDILLHERERSRLALDLHDHVLNQLALLAHSVADNPDDDKFLKAYEASVQSIREIISGLRPPMLNFGLGAALKGLNDEIAWQAGEDALATIDISPGLQRYHPEVELHLYRIIQQACHNAIQHSHAKKITIRGVLLAGQVELSVIDDGDGIDSSGPLDVDWLLAHKHFGLAGMYERAELIGAQLSFHSTAGMGTTVRVRWQSTEKQAQPPLALGSSQNAPQALPLKRTLRPRTN